jgi:hypothetical protein
MLTVESLSQNRYSVGSEQFQEKKGRAAGKEIASRREEKKKDTDKETDERSSREVECRSEQMRNSESKRKREPDMIQTTKCASIIATDPADD